jgi:hypothetical protein
MCFGRTSSSCSTCGTRRVTLVTNLVISHESGNEQEVFFGIINELKTVRIAKQNLRNIQ